MSVRVMNDVWHFSTCGGSELLMLLAIADNADETSRMAWPSVPYLAAKCRVSRSTTLRLLAKLEAREEIEIRRRTGKPNTYQVRTYEGVDSVTLTPVPQLRHHNSSTALTPEPSGTVILKSQTRAVAPVRDALWEALVAATGITPASHGERTRFGMSVRELLDLAATPEEIERRGAAFLAKYPGATLTDRALVNRWGELGNGHRPKPQRRFGRGVTTTQMLDRAAALKEAGR